MSTESPSPRGDPPLWLDGPERQPYDDDSAGVRDCVILGGGIAGTSAAWHLARAGVSCTLVERDRLASHASGRNDGQILLGLGEHYHRLVEQWGRGSAKELWHFLAENREAMHECIETESIECGLQRGGGLRLADTEHEMRELEICSATMHAEGIDHELLDASAVARVLPLGVGFHGALSLEGESIFDPHAFVLGLAQSARAAGCHVREESAATRVDGEAGDYRVHLQDGRTLEARTIVHAASALGLELDASDFLRRRVFPFRGQILATEAMSPELAAQMPRAAMSSNFCYEYWRMHGARLTLGGLRWSVRGEELGIRDDTRIHPEIARGLRDWLTRHFPALASLRPERNWTGIMAGTHDGLPLIGELPGRSGIYVSTAFNGYGMSFAFLAGRCLAEILTSGRARHAAATLFSPRRFVAL